MTSILKGWWRPGTGDSQSHSHTLLEAPQQLDLHTLAPQEAQAPCGDIKIKICGWNSCREARVLLTSGGSGWSSWHSSGGSLGQAALWELRFSLLSRGWNSRIVTKIIFQQCLDYHNRDASVGEPPPKIWELTLGSVDLGIVSKQVSPSISSSSTF